jgi:signal transduction histidine kinase
VQQSNEKSRLEALYSYAILDTEQEADFDNIVQLASQICGTPVSLISLVDLNRQWFKARKGFPPIETSRSVSFCAHALHQEEVLVIPDATKDARFADNSLVTDNPHIRFYAGAPLITPSGHSLGTLCVIDQKARSLTDQQLFALKTLARQVVAQLELRAKVGQLQQLNRAKDIILSVIAHDVKGPIQNVAFLLSHLEQNQIPADNFQFLATEMRKSLQTANGLLGNLLEWFMVQLEQHGVRYTPIALHALVEKIIAENRGAFDQKGNQVVNTLAPDQQLEGDANMLHFILRNLLLNANKFTWKGPISVSAESVPNGLQMRIQDTGIGIAPELQKRLFDWEKRSSTLGTAGEKGHGLGLLLCKEFVEKHGGTIAISSMPNRGTTVILTFPMNVLERARTTDANRAPEPD